MSFISWVVKIIVVFVSLLIYLIKFLIFSLATTSNPIVGSSKNIILGLCKKAAAISALIFWPRESCLTGCFRKSLMSSISVYRFRFFLYVSSGILYIAFSSSKESITAATSPVIVAMRVAGITSSASNIRRLSRPSKAGSMRKTATNCLPHRSSWWVTTVRTSS